MQSRFIFLLLYNYGKAAQNNEVILSGEQTQKLLIHLRHRMPFVSEETRRRQGRRRMETLPASVRYGPGTHLLWLELHVAYLVWAPSRCSALKRM